MWYKCSQVLIVVVIVVVIMSTTIYVYVKLRALSSSSLYQQVCAAQFFVEQLFCQHFTAEKLVAYLSVISGACLRLWQPWTGRQTQRDVWTERGNCCGFFICLRMTEFWVCFSCCIAEQPQPVSMTITLRSNWFTQALVKHPCFKCSSAKGGAWVNKQSSVCSLS